MTIQLTADDFGAAELFAFAPTGDSITGTLEASTTEFPISFFYKADDGTLVHEYSSSGQDGADTDTVSIDGQTVYIDVNGKWWLESALTFKTDEGDVVKEGVPTDDPLTVVDVCKALGDALNPNRKDAPTAHAALVALDGCNWLDTDPCDIPDLEKAKALARAAISVKAGVADGEKRWFNVCNRQGWNDHTVHLEGFIRELGLMDALAAYAERAAAEENGEASN